MPHALAANQADITMWATIVLACATVLYLIVTGWMARSARRAAKVTEQAHLVAIMPTLFGRKLVDGSPPTVELFGFRDLPAFGVVVEVVQKTSQTDYGWLGPLDHVMPTPRGKEVDVTFPGGFHAEAIDHPYVVIVTYYDAVGTPYRTTRVSLLAGQSASDIERLARRRWRRSEWEYLVRTVPVDWSAAECSRFRPPESGLPVQALRSATGWLRKNLRRGGTG